MLSCLHKKILSLNLRDFMTKESGKYYIHYPSEIAMGGGKVISIQ